MKISLVDLQTLHHGHGRGTSYLDLRAASKIYYDKQNTGKVQVTAGHSTVLLVLFSIEKMWKKNGRGKFKL